MFLSPRRIVPPAHRRLLSAAFAIVALVACLVVPFGTQSASAAEVHTQADQAAASRAMAPVVGFQAGNIISDDVFFNPNTMSAGDIDSFLRGKVTTCRSGYVCLKDYRQSTPNRGADAYCNGYSGGQNESAATIIYKASVSCGVNPQVILVMLEKEQSLVTHTWPSSWRYDMALGQGCPDTAPCDPAFSGFFYQIYGAARQMKIYAEGKYFTWYAPGKTWNIRYNPNAACGSSPVYIANKATAALYYYTPYQPNAAAIAAGYGEGDACSAYGNRNFYSFFTSWFGSTQTPQNRGPYLARAQGANEIYLMTNGFKQYIATVDDLLAYQSVLGTVISVPTTTISGTPTGQNASRYVHDPRTGTLYLLDPSGKKLRLPTQALIESYGYAFSSYVNIDGALSDKFPIGKDAGNVIRATGSGDVYLLTGTSVRHIVDSTALNPLVANIEIASINSAQFAKYSVGAKYFGAGRLVRPSDTPNVYLATSGSANIYVPSLDLAKLWGSQTTVGVVPAGSVDPSTVPNVGMAGAVTCGTETRVLDGSGWRVVTGTLGVDPTVLDADQCAALPKPALAATSGPVFVNDQGSGKVYLLDNNTLRHVPTYDLLLQQNGQRPLVVVNWGRDAVARYTIGKVVEQTPTLAENSFVQFSGKGEVYLFRSGQLHYVSTYDTLLALAGGQAPTVRTVDSSFFSSYTVGLAIAADGTFLQFSGQGEVYVVSGAQLRHVQSYATLISLNGGRPAPTIVTVQESAARAAYLIGNPMP